MLSSNTLKYNITVTRSFYAAVFVFVLYCSVILLLLLIFSVSWLTFPLFVFLLAVAVYGAEKAYRQRYQLKLSDSGLVEVSADGEVINGVVSASSFYNALFLSLHLKNKANDFSKPGNSKTFSIVIYRDAVNESEYRLLARLINFGRD